MRRSPIGPNTFSCEYFTECGKEQVVGVQVHESIPFERLLLAIKHVPVLSLAETGSVVCVHLNFQRRILRKKRYVLHTG